MKIVFHPPSIYKTAERLRDASVEYNEIARRIGNHSLPEMPPAAAAHTTAALQSLEASLHRVHVPMKAQAKDLAVRTNRIDTKTGDPWWKDFGREAVDFLVMDDVRTMRDPNAPWWQKGLIVVSLFPPARLVRYGAKVVRRVKIPWKKVIDRAPHPPWRKPRPRPISTPDPKLSKPGTPRPSTGAESAAAGSRLHAQLASREIADGHAYRKHVLEQGEFPGIRTRTQFAAMVENVMLTGEPRQLTRGRTAYYLRGVVVIRNPKAVDGGTAFAIDPQRYPDPRVYFEKVLK